VHRNIISIARPTRCTNVSNFLYFWNDTLRVSGRFFRPSSGVQDRTYSNRHLSNRYCCLFASGYEKEFRHVSTQPSFHPQEDFYTQFYGISFMHLYMQPGQFQVVFGTLCWLLLHRNITNQGSRNVNLVKFIAKN